MFKDALFDSSSRTRLRSPRPSKARRSTTPPHQDALTSRLLLDASNSRWAPPTRSTSFAGATSQSAGGQATSRVKIHIRGSDAPEDDMQAPIEHGRSQGG